MIKVFRLEGLDCAACASELEQIISKVGGVKNASVDFIAQKARFECGDERAAEEVRAKCNAFEDVKVIGEENEGCAEGRYSWKISTARRARRSWKSWSPE